MIKKLSLYWQIIISIFLAVGWTFLSVYLGWQDFNKNWISPFGVIFINLLKLIAVPLVLFSIIIGVASVSLGELKTTGIFALLFYIFTTFIAVLVGLFLVNIIEPGRKADQNILRNNRLDYEVWAKSNNIEIKSGFVLSQKEEVIKGKKLLGNKNKIDKSFIQKKKRGPLDFLVNMIPSNIFLSLSSNKLMLQVIFFSVFFGIILLKIESKRRSDLLNFFGSLNQVFLKMVDLLMRISPLFIFALMVSGFSSVGQNIKEVTDTLFLLGLYFLVVLLGLCFMIFLVYPILLYLFTKRSYASFFRNLAPAQLLAFSSSSSAATLPVTMECVHDNFRVSKSVSNVVLPIGATINMDGTSLYQTVAVVFLAQFYGISISFSDQLLVVLTTTLASIGSAAIPGGGIVLLMVVLESVGLNPAWIAFILPVDRILDMCRTVVNVSGDAFVACSVDKILKKKKPMQVSF